MSTEPARGDQPYAILNKESLSPQQSPVQKPNELDSMLGSLESDMKGHGVSVSTKGLCAACSKPIVGQVHRQ